MHIDEDEFQRRYEYARRILLWDRIANTIVAVGALGALAFIVWLAVA